MSGAAGGGEGRGGAGGPAQVQIRQLFPTPVALLQLPDAERLNADLKRIILAQEQAQPGTQHSNLGGWQSSWDFAAWGGKPAAALLAGAQRLAGDLTCDRAGRKVQVEWRVNAWANVNRSGHGNEFHTHPGCFWSGVYYVDDGGIGADPGLGGEFEIQDPRGVAPAMYAPRLTVAASGGAAMGAQETISPRSGLLILFPSWLSHAVRPYRGTAARISVAFNLSL